MIALAAVFLTGLFSGSSPAPAPAPKTLSIQAQRNAADPHSKACVCRYENYSVPCESAVIPEKLPNLPPGILPCILTVVLPQ